MENKWKKMISAVDTMGDWGGYQLYEWFKLFPEQRELVLLRFAQQLKLREIAQITGLPLRTVQSRLRAALKTLKMQLEKEDWR